MTDEGRVGFEFGGRAQLVRQICYRVYARTAYATAPARRMPTLTYVTRRPSNASSAAVDSG
eukprot:scaffold1682_cov159-Pinguiococcus_pyrenoidosus.AAC.3